MTPIHDARETFMVNMFQQMADGHVAGAESAAEGAVERLIEASADLRSVALLAPDGEVLATSAPNDWSERARDLWAATATAADGTVAERVHVATEDGEVFAVRSPNGSVAIAVAQRFSLASLMFCDLRAALRGVDAQRTASPAHSLDRG